MELGAWGEKEACRYLIGKRYRIIERNARRTWGELDIVAQSPERILVLVEVKTVREAGPEGLTPEDQMSKGKIERFRRAATLYAGSHQNLIDPLGGWRLDVIAIIVRHDSSFHPRRGFGERLRSLFMRPLPYSLKHYENI